MKDAIFTAAITAISVIAFASFACAGVVISQTEEKAGPAGHSAESRTIYVQGNKEKIDTPHGQTIADLDRSVLYIVDVNRRAYEEVPLHAAAQSPQQPGGSASDTAVRLKRTGASRKVGAYPCEEYRGGGGNAVERLSVSACVSRQVPGANEVEQFDRRMLRQMTGVPAASGKDSSAGIVLEETSKLEVNVPAAHGQQPAPKIAATSKRRVNDIKLQQFPSTFFKPPEGFSKVEPNASGGNMI